MNRYSAILTGVKEAPEKSYVKGGKFYRPHVVSKSVTSKLTDTLDCYRSLPRRNRPCSRYADLQAQL